MNKYLVISYDGDEQQTFFDFVLAEDEDKAKAEIDRVRPYAIAVTACDASELRSMAKNLRSTTVTNIKDTLREIARESAVEA